MSAAVLRADARTLPLPDASVDLIVTSPPYFGLRSYTDGGEHYGGQIGSEATPREWLAAMLECTREWVRVLKPSGSIFVNLGDKYANRSGTGWGRESTWEGRGRPETIKQNSPHRRPDTSRSIGVPEKSLLGLPWRYALACMGGATALNNPDVVKLLLRDVALGVLTLAEAEAAVDDLAAYPEFDDLGLILRRDIIWSKPNGLPESVTDRCRSSHEYVFHLVKQPRYYAAVDEIRSPHDFPAQTRTKGRSMNGGAASGGAAARLDTATVCNPLGKLPGSVWDIPSQPLTVPASLGVDHFAAFPMELPRRIILGWSPPGICVACGEGRRPVSVADYVGVAPIAATDKAHRAEQGNTFATRALGRAMRRTDITGYACACPDATAPTRPSLVVDPFGGTGTTALVAAMYGRVGLSFDLSADYGRLARWRVTDPAERAKAMQVPKPPPIADGQEPLFA